MILQEDSNDHDEFYLDPGNPSSVLQQRSLASPLTNSKVEEAAAAATTTGKRNGTLSSNRIELKSNCERKKQNKKNLIENIVRKKQNPHKNCSFWRSNIPQRLRLSIVPDGWTKKVIDIDSGKQKVHFTSPVHGLFKTRKKLLEHLASDKNNIENNVIQDYDFCPFDAGEYCPTNKIPCTKKSATK